MSYLREDPTDHYFKEEKSVVLVGPEAPYFPRMDYCRRCGKHKNEHTTARSSV